MRPATTTVRDAVGAEYLIQVRQTACSYLYSTLTNDLHRRQPPTTSVRSDESCHTSMLTSSFSMVVLTREGHSTCRDPVHPFFRPMWLTRIATGRKRCTAQPCGRPP